MSRICPTCGAPATDHGGIAQRTADIGHIDVYDLGQVRGPVRLRCRPGALARKPRPRPDSFTRGERDALGWARDACSRWADKGRGAADSMRSQFPWLSDVELALIALYIGESIRYTHRFRWPDMGPEEYSALYRAAAVDLADLEMSGSPG